MKIITSAIISKLGSDLAASGPARSLPAGAVLSKKEIKHGSIKRAKAEAERRRTDNAEPVA